MTSDPFDCTYVQAENAINGYDDVTSRARARGMLEAFRKYPTHICAAAFSDACGGTNWRGCTKGHMMRDAFIQGKFDHSPPHALRERHKKGEWVATVFVNQCATRVKWAAETKARKNDQERELAKIGAARDARRAKLLDIAQRGQSNVNGPSDEEWKFFFKWAIDHLQTGIRPVG